MERMGARRAGEQNGDGTIAGATAAATAGRTGAVRAVAATAAVVAAAALAGCSVTVQPKNAAASRPLSSSPTPSSVSTSAPSTRAASSSALLSSSSSPSPTVTPSDVDHAVCTNVREALATLKSKLVADKDSVSRSSQDYRTAGTTLRVQDTKTDNAELKATLKAVGTDYQNVGHDIANHDAPDTDLSKAAEASKPLGTLCGGGSGSGSGSSTGTGPTSSSSSSSSN